MGGGWWVVVVDDRQRGEVYVVHGRLWVYFPLEDSGDLPCQVEPLLFSVNPPAGGTLRRVGSLQS